MHKDIVVVGAGISGIAAGYNLQKSCPDKSFVILEGRESLGGTWDLFKYPGVRSDSDMHTLGFRFKPWIHKKSIAEDVVVLINNPISESTDKYNGPLLIEDGVVRTNGVNLSGKSLVHSAELTAVAFKSGVLGVYGGYIVAIGLLLFAFSTAIAWSYYGDRSAAYVFGEKSVVWYRLVYVGCFFIAAIIDTEVVWNLAYIIGPLVTIPNVIALIILRKEMKSMSDSYVIDN